MKIKKEAGVIASGAPDGQQLEKINRFTKRALRAEEVYVFAVRLCDDQPDRDNERFSGECIRELAELFVGKTGVIDHTWSAEKQVARIFQTSVEYEAGVMYLKAWAYMLRGEADELICQIEGGIKKEVSIGCAVKRKICSVCGAEYGTCEHRKGERYGQQVCTAVLCEATDAYEFSFVAVPAQKQAGVLQKGMGMGEADTPELRQLRREAELGRMYRKELGARAARAAGLLELGLSGELVERMTEALAVEELQKLTKTLEQRTAELFAPMPQMRVEKECALEENSAFLI